MKRILHHFFVFPTKSQRHKDFFSWCLGAFVVILFFFPTSVLSQISDSTIQVLEKRIQILEQKILQLEYIINSKSDSLQMNEKKEEPVVEEKKEEFIQCSAKTAKGTRCIKRAKHGSKFCGFHQFEGESKKKK